MREHLENYKYVKNNVKKIFIMGDQDHVFLPTIKKFVPEEDIVVIKIVGIYAILILLKLLIILH